MKGKRFDSPSELNAYLRRWNRNIASLRIHGTTRRQVIAHFLEAEKDMLSPLPSSPFEYFRYGERHVYYDGHIRVDHALCSVPPHLLQVWVYVRFTDRLVRVYYSGELVTVHGKKPPGTFSTHTEHSPEHKPAKAEGYERYQLSRAEKIGPGALAWAKSAITARGPRSYRLLRGLFGLTGKYPAEAVNWVCEVARQSSDTITNRSKGSWRGRREGRRPSSSSGRYRR